MENSGKTAFLTVFTPTYNRAYTLPALYESLCRQTCGDFVWSIVDDGSTDGTPELVRGWAEEQKLDIRYHRQENGGKMRAHNAGVRHCTTPLFVCVDSDDFVPDNFVDRVAAYRSQIETDNHLAGMVAYKSCREHPDGEFRVRCRFPFSGTSPLGRLYKSGFSGDTTLVFKTDVLRRFPFLEIVGEKFSTEAYAYDQIDQEYAYLLVDEAWTLCTYLPDGYTHRENALWAQNPKGVALYYNQRAEFTRAWLNKDKIAYGILYMIYARRAGFPHIWRQSALKTPFYPAFWLLSYYYEWKWKERFPR
ncbi:MAG: glycosyltransferase family 2 protein [Bacteroidales bacterium]|nr:glycosyltransferase family 2 protein [Bacteroidales bacterium]